MTWIIILLVVALIVLAVVGVLQYNKLHRLNINAEEAFAQIEVQLKRRADLVPNLVGAVRGYAEHEKGTLEEVTKARTQALQATSFDDTVAADGALTQALRGLLAVAESYPDLKASANFLSLQEELAATENKVAFARQYYNDSVNSLNTACVTLPSSLFTGIAKVSKREFYEVEDPADREVPKVEF